MTSKEKDRSFIFSFYLFYSLEYTRQQCILNIQNGSFIRHSIQHTNTVGSIEQTKAEDGTFHCPTDVLNETLLLKRKTRTDRYRNDPNQGQYGIKMCFPLFKNTYETVVSIMNGKWLRCNNISKYTHTQFISFSQLCAYKYTYLSLKVAKNHFVDVFYLNCTNTMNDTGENRYQFAMKHLSPDLFKHYFHLQIKSHYCMASAFLSLSLCVCCVPVCTAASKNDFS